MRHQKHGRKFGRVRNQRKALFKTMLGSLIMKEKINTTEAKAKELKIKIDRIVNKAKKAQETELKVAVIRDLGKYIPKMAVSKIITPEFVGKFEKRSSGYCRVIKLAPRKGDGAKMAVIEFV
jgi:large subunit ribosomal protein L17